MAVTVLRRGDSGAAVRQFQGTLNRRAEPRFYPPLITDGEFGPTTRYAFEALGFALGLTPETLAKPEVTTGAQRIVTDPGSREATQLERARERGPRLHARTVSFDGTPTFWGLAKPLLRARERGWSGTLQSSDRRAGVAEQFGKRSQQALFDCAERAKRLGGRCPADCAGNCNPANPPGFSSHECCSDGTAVFGKARGGKLPWWMLGLDVSDVHGLLRELKEMGYSAVQTYPDSPRERHHVNFTKNPGLVLPQTGPSKVPAKPPKRTGPPKTTRQLTGPDVSNHQPDVDWEKVKRAGHAFALVKVSEGLGAPDRVFGKGRWTAMRDAGLVRGAYHFARPQKGRDPRAEVHEFLRLLDKAGGLQDGDLLPVLDIEAFGAAGRLTAKQTVQWARGFVDEMRARIGRRPIIYTGAFWRDEMGNPPDAFGCPLWLAAYVPASKVPRFLPQAWTDAGPAIWQHTDKGTCAGVPTPCDMNILKGGTAALDKLRV